MTPRRLIVLSSLAVVGLAVAIWLASRQTGGSAQAHGLLYDSLGKQLDQITSVRLYESDAAPAVELRKADAGWTVANRFNFPADAPRLGRLLRAMADARILEEKTSNPANYATLGVADLAEGSTSTRVDLESTQPPISLIIGKPAAGTNSQYVRRAGEPQSWLVSGDFAIDTAPHAWLRREIVDIGADRIQALALTFAKGRNYSAEKPARTDADFKVNGIPRGKELNGPSAANNFATALVNLTLNDVRPSSEITGAPAATAEFKTFDGLVLKLEGHRIDEQHFITAQAAFDAQQAQRFHLPTQATEEATEESPAATPDSSQKVQEEAQSLQTRLAGWAFEIPDYKYDAIFRPLDELLK